MAATREKSTRHYPQGTEGTAHSRLELFAWGLADFPDPVVVADENLRIIFVNRAAYQMLGLEAPSASPPDTEAALPTDITNQLGVVLVPCLHGRNLDRRRLRLHLHNSRWIDLAVSCQIIKDSGKQTVGCVAILRDLQADLMAQPEIKSQISLLGSILKNFPTPFFMVDKNLTVTEMNHSLEVLTGYSRQEAVGRMTCADLLCTGICKTDSCLLLQAMETGSFFSGVRQVILD